MCLKKWLFDMIRYYRYVTSGYWIILWFKMDGIFLSTVSENSHFSDILKKNEWQYRTYEMNVNHLEIGLLLVNTVCILSTNYYWYSGNSYLRFFQDFRRNVEERFLLYYMHSDVFSMVNLGPHTRHYCVIEDFNLLQTSLAWKAERNNIFCPLTYIYILFIFMGSIFFLTSIFSHSIP